MFSVQCHRTRCLEEGKENDSTAKLETAPSIESMHFLHICLWCYEGYQDAFHGTSAPKESVLSWDIDSSTHYIATSPYMAGANAECTATGKTVRHIIRKLNTHAPHLTNGSTVILPLSKYLSKRNGIYVHTKAYSFTHIGKKVDTPKLSISW